MVISNKQKKQIGSHTLEKDIISEDHHHSSAHPHVHSEESLKRLINRLSRIEGHVRGIKTMIKDHRAVRANQDGDIDVEIAALKSALDRFLP